MSEEFLVDPDHRTPPGSEFNVGDIWKVKLMRSAHVHSHVEINLLLAGAMTYLFNGRTVTLRKGDLGIFWAAIPHRVIEVVEPTYFICIDLPVEMFLAMPGCDPLKTPLLQGGLLVANRHRPFDEQLFKSWHGDMEQPGEAAHGLVRDELAIRLRRIVLDGWRDLASDEEERLALETDPRSGEHQRDRAHRMARYIAEHAIEPISVSDIAAAVGLHPNYAMTLFRKTLGMTVNEYVTRQRLMLAHGRLLASERDIAEIAFEAGFGSLSRFYEAFKQRYGCTPRDMRRNFQLTREAASPQS
jgi:AraC family transcriptional regulator, melibiose operon regulatory protein